MSEVGDTVRGRDQFRRWKPVINVISGWYSLLPLNARIRALERRRYTRGKIGLGLRYAILKSVAHRCGDNVAIFPDVYLIDPQNLDIGDNVSIHSMSYIVCGNQLGGVTIGCDVSIAHRCTLMAANHNFHDRAVPIRDQGVSFERILIQDNVWIGANVVVTAGVTVASGCVIGAGAVVTKDTEGDSVYAGAPAKRIKER